MDNYSDFIHRLIRFHYLITQYFFICFLFFYFFYFFLLFDFYSLVVFFIFIQSTQEKEQDDAPVELQICEINIIFFIQIK
jgi:hypothetical protein